MLTLARQLVTGSLMSVVLILVCISSVKAQIIDFNQVKQAYIVLEAQQHTTLNLTGLQSNQYLMLNSSWLSLEEKAEQVEKISDSPLILKIKQSNIELTISSAISHSFDLKALSSAQVIAAQNQHHWLVSGLLALNVALLIFAVFASVLWQKALHYWLAALSLSSLGFISLYTGQLASGLGLPTAFNTGPALAVLALLFVMSAVALNKYLFDVKQTNQKTRLILNLFITKIAVLAIVAMFVSGQLAMSIAAAVAIGASLLGGWLCGQHKDKSEQAKWMAFTWLASIVIWSVWLTQPELRNQPTLVVVVLLQVLVAAFSLMAQKLSRLQQNLDEVSKLNQMDASLKHAALHDKLTGLPNQLALERFFERNKNEIHKKESALVLIKVKHFEKINHALGFSTGDLLLIQIAKRIQEFLQKKPEVFKMETDGIQSASLAALSGVRFAFLADTSKHHHLLENLSNELDKIMPEPISTQSLVVSMESVMGVALSPQDGSNIDELLQKAQIALDYAETHSALMREYDQHQETFTQEQREMAAELRQAVEQDQLKLMVHPVVDINSRELISAEALVRWRHPKKGLIQPNKFIELAERTGVIYGLTRWVLQESIKAAAAWRESGLNIAVSVNLSNRDLIQHELIDMISDLLSEHHLPARNLVLEINEQALLQDPQLSHDAMERLDKLGVKTIIDDFGTGYSSLVFLRKLPLYGLKIDRSFVSSMTEGDTQRTIVNTVIDIGRNLSLKVIAEGVEDLEVEDKLKRMGVNLAQGFLYSRPFEMEGFVSWAKQWASFQQCENEAQTDTSQPELSSPELSSSETSAGLSDSKPKPDDKPKLSLE